MLLKLNYIPGQTTILTGHRHSRSGPLGSAQKPHTVGGFLTPTDPETLLIGVIKVRNAFPLVKLLACQLAY